MTDFIDRAIDKAIDPAAFADNAATLVEPTADELFNNNAPLPKAPNDGVRWTDTGLIKCIVCGRLGGVCDCKLPSEPDKTDAMFVNVKNQIKQYGECRYSKGFCDGMAANEHKLTIQMQSAAQVTSKIASDQYSAGYDKGYAEAFHPGAFLAGIALGVLASGVFYWIMG